MSGEFQFVPKTRYALCSTSTTALCKQLPDSPNWLENDVRDELGEMKKTKKCKVESNHFDESSFGLRLAVSVPHSYTTFQTLELIAHGIPTQ